MNNENYIPDQTIITNQLSKYHSSFWFNPVTHKTEQIAQGDEHDRKVEIFRGLGFLLDRNKK